MSWSILGFTAPISESATLYVLHGNDLQGSQVQFHGTGLTYDPVTGFLNGGTITSADLVANGEIVQTITMTGGLAGSTFSNFWVPAKALYSQVASWGATSQTPTSFASNLITLYLPDGTTIRLEGNGFSNYSNLGTVTAVKHFAADGVTLLGAATGLPEPLGIVAAALGGDKGFYHYLDQGNNTVTQHSSNQFVELDGGAGTNTIVGLAASNVYLPVSFFQATSSVTIDLAAHTAIGRGVNDTLVNIHSVVGSTFGDIIKGDTSNDFLFGGAGNDTITGGSGNDLISGGAGNNSLDGGSGTNTIDYSWTSAGVAIDLRAASNQAYSLNTSDVVFIDQLKNFQSIIGSAGNDIIHAGSVGITIDGGTGADQIYGGSGNDTIVYHADDTVIMGGGGTNTLLIVNDIAPTSFNLTAHQFQVAQVHTTNSASFQSQTDIYNAGWQLTERDTTNNDNSSSVTLLDVANVQTWSQVTTYTNAAGQTALQSVAYDDHTSLAVYFDPTNVQTWSRADTSYDALGRTTLQSIANHDGTSRATYYDPGNLQTWTSADTFYDTHGSTTLQSVANDDGTSHVQYWDTTSVQPWSTATLYYNAAHVLVLTTGVYDNGTTFSF